MKEFLKLTFWSGIKVLIPTSNVQHVEEDKDGSIVFVNILTKKGCSPTDSLFVKESVDEIASQLGV